MDDSSINNDVEMLNNMVIRQRRYIKDLENALVVLGTKPMVSVLLPAS